MKRPFELSLDELNMQLEEMVDATFADLQSQFLTLPKGDNFIEYHDFQRAYETLRQQTKTFSALTSENIWTALRENSLAFVVLRTILGMSPPEWAELAREEFDSDISQGAARTLDVRARRELYYFRALAEKPHLITYARVVHLIDVATHYLSKTHRPSPDTIHRLDKVDTREGIISLQHAASHHIPYAVLLYERYLGRPFASHRDSVSELIGAIVEDAIEKRLNKAKVTYRQTKRAERIPGFGQAPDFFIPDEYAPAVIIEAKITGDDGTARDKVARIIRLASIRDEKKLEGEEGFEVVACIDGRGFGERRQDMRDVLLATEGKVFTLSTLDRLVEHTRIRNFVSS